MALCLALDAAGFNTREVTIRLQVTFGGINVFKRSQWALAWAPLVICGTRCTTDIMPPHKKFGTIWILIPLLLLLFSILLLKKIVSGVSLACGCAFRRGP